MAQSMALPDTSSFMGVALVINRNREGPRFVFHYPSIITPPQDSQHRKELSNEEVDDDDIFVESTAAHARAALGGSRDFMPNPSELARWNHDDHLVADNGTQFVPWEYVVGLPTKALEGILTPPRAFHKKRFQMSLDSVTYISYPVHVPSNGVWARRRNATDKNNSKAKDKAASTRGASTGRAGETSAGGAASATQGKDKEEKVSSMTMFTLVFIMSPKRHEANELLDTMYTHVVREVNKVYKYCQESGDFIWQECKKIIQLKDHAREDRVKMSVLWKDILAVSSLAASMRDTYEAISRNRIAVLELNLSKGSVGHSVQIPVPFFATDIQPQAGDSLKNLWLTTANNVSRHETLDGVPAFDKCFALLLTDDDETKIIAELEARGDKAAATMIELVKASKPTLSFYQVSQLPDTILTIHQIRAYAQHFIYWRRAMAVPPIHARDVYILSPNCDIDHLARASAVFAETFPFAPPLPDLLASLSSAPRPYKSFCPTKSLRPAYLRILAWLIRGGWVCQLCTFAYVVVWPEIQYEVEYNLEAEDLARIKQKQQQKMRDGGRDNVQSSRTSLSRGLSSSNLYQEKEHRRQQQYAGDDSDDGEEGDVGEIGGLSEMSGTMSSMPSSARHDRDRAKHGGKSAAEHAAERARRQRMAEKAAHSLAERATVHARKPLPTRTSHPSINNAPHLAGIQPYVIMDASKPTGKESLFLSAIERNLRACRATPPPASKKDVAAQHEGPRIRYPTSGNSPVDETTAWNERVAEMWPVFWKHLNGHSALERIALLEDMKRKDVWNLLSSMSEYLLCVRHW
ncbi:uncharacterized protein SPSK_07060 [Sporothrix schenckii 1099-18]|uniref:Nitrogen permease regulator 3 n=2 Tax=Sporothrix schenckii TaxID=29908 RepID=U7Q027_SPOS1|nr:uncharacterized protein SPSK_07060 [Sporothrix schenckii 1099-18]ERT01259.1 hypothetical protein HMPREF1624_02501 [Sporothrix schenckii ATCC 58251]KJR88415.1 hypothetical protein SPSK_07060 [Sporothrix schenckii 1099-18]